MDVFAYSYPSMDAAGEAFDRAYAAAMQRGQVSVMRVLTQPDNTPVVAVIDPEGGMRELVEWGPEAVEYPLSRDEARALMMRRVRAPHDGPDGVIEPDGTYKQRAHYEPGKHLGADGRLT